MVPSEVYPDVDFSGPVPPNSTIRIHIQPHHILSNIPYDIFLMIAFLCWDRESDDRDPNFPITATHVCRTWRRYALDTGAFWTSLEFRQNNPHRVIMKYKIWLERSKDSPLDIFIGPQPFKGASVKHAKSIMRLIMPHVGHWRSLRVELPPKKIIRLIFDRLRDVSAPMLETLKVSGERWTRPFRPLVSTGLNLAPFVHGEASNLKELLLEGFPYRYFVTRFRTLQVLRLDHPEFFRAGAVENVKSVQHILISLPGLRVLRIGCARPASNILFSLGPQNVPPPPRISHPSLTILSISLLKVDQDIVLGSLTLPNVRYFRAGSGLQIEAELGLGLLPSLSEYRPFPNLVSLRIGARPSLSRPPADPVKLVHLEGALAGLPQLKALTFDYLEFEGNKWLSCLGTTCPQLHWLTFIECGGFILEPLRDIVETRRRRPGFGSLVKLVIQQWSDGEGITIDEETNAWLKRSLVLEITVPAQPYSMTDYLSVVEGVKP